RALDEDAPNRLGRRGEEMGSAIPLPVFVPNQPQPRLVNQRSGLKCLARRLPSHPRGGQLAQLLIDQRKQFFGGLGVAVLRSFEDSRQVTHGWGGCDVGRAAFSSRSSASASNWRPSLR